LLIVLEKGIHRGSFVLEQSLFIRLLVAYLCNMTDIYLFKTDKQESLVLIIENECYWYNSFP
jgi:hypothetical protein